MIRDSRLAFVGDLHGDVEGLRKAVTFLRDSGRVAVFLGDYVDRGKDSRLVLDLLVNLAGESQDFVFLRGNHDQAMLDVLNGEGVESLISMGGLPTLASYIDDDVGDLGSDFRSAVPSEHKAFLESLTDYFECAEVFASHAGIDPHSPLVRTREVVVNGFHPEMFTMASHPSWSKPVVCGHYIQRAGRPFVSSWLYAIDTGCGSINGAPLTVLLWPEGTYLQFKGAYDD